MYLEAPPSGVPYCFIKTKEQEIHNSSPLMGEGWDEGDMQG